MRISFQEELDELERSLHAEGELVLRSLRGAVEAVCAQDIELADEVIAFDDDIDAQFFEIEQGIEHGPFAAARIESTTAELLEEREAVAELLA